MREWFETRLFLPFLPFGFDLLLRVLALHGHVRWWQLPDLKTFAITTSFFCFLLAMDLKSAGKLPSDADHHQTLSALRKRFLIQGLVSAVIFGSAAGIDAADKFYGREDLSIAISPSLVIIISLMLIISIADALLANMRYKLSYSV